MKNKLILSLVVYSLLTIISCREDSEVRIPDFIVGPNVRIQVDPLRSFLDFTEINAAYIGYGIYSESTNLEKVDIFVKYVPNGVAKEDAGDSLRLRTYTQNDFTNAGGALRDQRITSQQLADVFDLEVADFTGGDEFLFFNVTTMADGTIYPSKVVGDQLNVTEDLIGARKTTSYTYSFDAVVGCPVEAEFTGDYTLEELNGPGDPFNGDPFVWTPGKVTLEEVNPVTRRFVGKLYDGGTFSFEENFTFNLICGKILVSNASGVNCGGNTFKWISQGENPFDPSDDNVITINILHNTSEACGEPTSTLTLRLTKI